MRSKIGSCVFQTDKWKTVNWAWISAIRQHIKTPNGADNSLAIKTKAGFVVKINFFAGNPAGYFLRDALYFWQTPSLIEKK